METPDSNRTKNFRFSNLEQIGQEIEKRMKNIKPLKGGTHLYLTYFYDEIHDNKKYVTAFSLKDAAVKFRLERLSKEEKDIFDGYKDGFSEIKTDDALYRLSKGLPSYEVDSDSDESDELPNEYKQVNIKLPEDEEYSEKFILELFNSEKGEIIIEGLIDQYILDTFKHGDTIFVKKWGPIKN